MSHRQLQTILTNFNNLMNKPSVEHLISILNHLFLQVNLEQIKQRYEQSKPCYKTLIVQAQAKEICYN